MDSLSVARIVAILGLVAANAFFVAAEFALVASKHLLQEEPGEDPLRADPTIARARRSLERPISSAQVGITFSSLALAEDLTRELEGTASRLQDLRDRLVEGAPHGAESSRSHESTPGSDAA